MSSGDIIITQRLSLLNAENSESMISNDIYRNGLELSRLVGGNNKRLHSYKNFNESDFYLYQYRNSNTLSLHSRPPSAYDQVSAHSHTEYLEKHSVHLKAALTFPILPLKKHKSDSRLKKTPVWYFLRKNRKTRKPPRYTEIKGFDEAPPIRFGCFSGFVDMRSKRCCQYPGNTTASHRLNCQCRTLSIYPSPLIYSHKIE